ncbi:MAG: hypothetical protein WC413_01610 [Candidatus Nanoarchaeia archaeon]
MKNKFKIGFLSILLVLSLISVSNLVSAGTPHTVYGYVFDATDGTLANGATITAYIESRPSETLTGTVDATNWWDIDVGNFPTAWSAGNNLIIKVDKSGHKDTTNIILDTSGAQQAYDMTLLPQYDLDLSPTTQTINTVPGVNYYEYYINITNMGYANDTFLVYLNGEYQYTTDVLPSYWYTEDMWYSNTTDTLAGTYIDNITVVSQHDSTKRKTFLLTIIVNPIYGIDLSPKTQSISVYQGTDFEVSYNVTNIGNINDTYLVYLNGKYNYSIDELPSYWSSEEFWDYTADEPIGTVYTDLFFVISEHNPNVNDTFALTVTVIAPPCVPNWILNSTWTTCNLLDSQSKNYYDSNSCGNETGKPTDITQSCDFCTPNIIAIAPGSCSINDTATTIFDDSNNCYAQTGLESDQVPNPIVNSCDYCTPSISSSNSTCGTNDLFTETFTDSNGCYAQTGLILDNVPLSLQYTCDYCTPNIQTTTENCTTSDTYTTTFTDLNGCFGVTGLVLDAVSVPTINSCDYCTPLITSTNSTCQPNNTSTETFTDSNGCYGLTNLNADKIPNPIIYGCVYVAPSCSPDNWTLNTTWSSCNANDLQYQVYYDPDNCNNNTGKPTDVSQACDFCTPSIFDTNSTCQLNDLFTQSFSDNNNCFAQTSLVADKVPNSNSYSCDYCTPLVVLTNSSCSINDTFTESFTDSNGCYAQTNLASDIVIPAPTLYACDFCNPSLTSTNSTCQPTNTLTEIFADSNGCFALTNLVSDDIFIPNQIVYNCTYVAPVTSSGGGGGGGGGGGSGKPTCVEKDYNFTDWSECLVDGKSTRTYILNNKKCIKNTKTYDVTLYLEKDCYYKEEKPVQESIEEDSGMTGITGGAVVDGNGLFSSIGDFFSGIWNWFKNLF